MYFTPERIEFLRSLTPPDPRWGGTGARPLSFDPRDIDLRSDPNVQAMLPCATGPNGDILNLILGPPDNQGASPACVAFSTGNASSMDEAAVAQIWESYDCATLYREAGGNGSNGVDTRVTLDIAVKQGIPYTGGRRKVIGSYAFVPQQLGIWRETIKASILAGQPVTLALLLPIPFGWNSGTVRSSGYHQVIICGWMTDNQGVEWWIVFNSWGPGWPGEAGSPKPGVGRVRCDFVEADAFQNSYAYAFGTQRVAIPNPTPVPVPVPPVPVPPVPVPPVPKPVVVSGYNGGVPIPGIQPGAMFGVQGSGFAGGNLFVSLGGQPLQASRQSDTLLAVQAPAQAITAPVHVRVEGSEADGPLLAILPSGSPTPNPQPQPQPEPQPQPQPDGGIQVFLTTKPSQFRNTVSIVVYTADKDGHSFPASVNGTVTGPNGVVPLQGMTTHGTTSPVIYTVDRPAPWGTPCTVEINAFNGSSTGSATKPG